MGTAALTMCANRTCCHCGCNKPDPAPTRQARGQEKETLRLGNWTFVGGTIERLLVSNHGIERTSVMETQMITPIKYWSGGHKSKSCALQLSRTLSLKVSVILLLQLKLNGPLMEMAPN